MFFSEPNLLLLRQDNLSCHRLPRVYFFLITTVVTDTQLMLCIGVDYSDKDVKIAKDVVGADK